MFIDIISWWWKVNLVIHLNNIDIYQRTHDTFVNLIWSMRYWPGQKLTYMRRCAKTEHERKCIRLLEVSQKIGQMPLYYLIKIEQFLVKYEGLPVSTNLQVKVSFLHFINKKISNMRKEENPCGLRKKVTSNIC